MERTGVKLMGYFIDANGTRLVIDSTHLDYAKHQLKMSLAEALKSHVRVAIHADRLCLETDQKVLTIRQKHTLTLIYREHHCRGYASRIDCHAYESNYYETVRKINFQKCMGKN
jgi:hypothetical protein